MCIHYTTSTHRTFWMFLPDQCATMSATVTSSWLVISCLSSSQTAVTIIKPPNNGDVRSTVALHFIVSIRQPKVRMCMEQGHLKCHISFIVTVIYLRISDDQCLLMGSNVQCSTDKVTFYAHLVFFCSSHWFNMSSLPARERLKVSRRTTGHILKGSQMQSCFIMEEHRSHAEEDV